MTGPFNRVVQSWDTAFKKGSENDFSVCTTWGITDVGYYLLHVWRERAEFPELKRLLASLAEQWKPNAILIEDRASGQSLIQELKTSSTLPIIPVKVDSDKLARAQAVTPLLEAGKVFLPDSAQWVSDFIDELAAFPSGLHDDLVDSMTQALNYLRAESFSSLTELFVKMNAPDETNLDIEELWHKAMNGMPLTEEEFNRL
jgi:predicted phage terminase large subunit-like protein